MNILDFIGQLVNKSSANAAEAPLPTAQGTGGAPMTPIPGMGAAPVQAQAPQQKGGILKFLENLIAPEPGSFMHSAYNNKIWNAKEGQQQWQVAKAQQDLALQQAQREARFGKTQITPRGDAIRVRPTDGAVEEMYRPAPQPGEQERILDQWRKTADPAEKQLLSQMLRGYPYGRGYLRDKTDEAMRLEETKTDGRARVAAIPRTSIRSGSTDNPVIPPGFIPDN